MQRKTSAVSFARTALSVAACCVMGSALAAHAPAKPDAHLAALQSVVLGMTHGAAKVYAVVPGPQSNIEGVLAHVGRGNGFAWVIDGKYLVTGPLIGSAGQNLTLKAAQDYGLVPKPAPAAKVAKEAMASEGFMMGKAGPVVAVFEDPNCLWCHKLWQDAKPMLDAGKLRMWVVPVGVIKPDSAAKVASIMASKNPAKAWDADEATFDVAHEEGGASVGKVTPQIRSMLDANERVLASTGAVSTPTMVYCLKAGKPPVVTTRGVPAPLLSQAASSGVSLNRSGVCQ